MEWVGKTHTSSLMVRTIKSLHGIKYTNIDVAPSILYA